MPCHLEPCRCCGRVETDVAAVEPIGIMRVVNGMTVLILFQCPCHSTRAIPWTQAPDALKTNALRAARALIDRRVRDIDRDL